MGMEKTEIAKEQINGLEKEDGGKEKLLELKKHLDEVLARMQESEIKAENKVVEAGGAVEILNEKTSDVDERINEVKKNIEGNGELSEDEKIKRLLSIEYINDKLGWETPTSSDAILKILKGDPDIFKAEKAYEEALVLLARKDFAEPVKAEVKTESPQEIQKRKQESQDIENIKLLRKNIPHIGSAFTEKDNLKFIFDTLEDWSHNGTEDTKKEWAGVLIQAKKLLNI